MLDLVQKFFHTHIANEVAEGSAKASEHACQLAGAALLIEMTRADFDIKTVERQAVTRAVSKAFDLDSKETGELLRLAESRAEHATSLYEFTRLINDHFDDQQKACLVEQLWHVAYADGELDKYEEHLVRKIAELIHVRHTTFIQAKHQAKTWFESCDP